MAGDARITVVVADYPEVKAFIDAARHLAVVRAEWVLSEPRPVREAYDQFFAALAAWADAVAQMPR